MNDTNEYLSDAVSFLRKDRLKNKLIKENEEREQEEKEDDVEESFSNPTSLGEKLMKLWVKIENKSQEEKKNALQPLLTKFTFSTYEDLEDNNYHSLNRFITDLFGGYDKWIKTQNVKENEEEKEEELDEDGECPKNFTGLKPGQIVIYKGETGKGFETGKEYKIDSITSDSLFRQKIVLINGKQKKIVDNPRYISLKDGVSEEEEVDERTDIECAADQLKKESKKVVDGDEEEELDEKKKVVDDEEEEEEEEELEDVDEDGKILPLRKGVIDVDISSESKEVDDEEEELDEKIDTRNVADKLKELISTAKGSINVEDLKKILGTGIHEEVEEEEEEEQNAKKIDESLRRVASLLM